MNKLETILKKAGKCESCEKPLCIVGCPLNNDVKSFIKYIKDEDYKKAYNTLSKTTFLESICGRICPHERQCQGACTKSINKKSVEIGKLEAFIGDLAIENKWTDKCKKDSNYKVAVIGGGPAGLTCSAFLKKNGINVTIYEKHNYLGGLLVHGIPEFRLPRTTANEAIKRIIDLGIDVKYNQELGKDFTLKDLVKKYHAVFIGIGANISNKAKIPGEKLKGVYGANEFLESKRKIDFKDKIVYVYGGGNVAMDVSRTIKKLGPKKVGIIYRKSEKELKAEKKEIKAAKLEGIDFIYNCNITKVVGKEKAEYIELIKTKYNENTSLLENIKGSKQKLKCDYLIKAVGSHANTRLLKNLNLELTNQGRIKVNKTANTSISKVFAGGDVIGSISTVAWAARTGRNAAYSIIECLNRKKDQNV